MALFPIFCGFVCVHSQLDQAVTEIFKCLAIDKEKITVLFPGQQVSSAQTCQAQIIMKGFIPKMKSGSHVCILNVLKVSRKGALQEYVRITTPWPHSQRKHYNFCYTAARKNVLCYLNSLSVLVRLIMTSVILVMSFSTTQQRGYCVTTT